MRVTLDDYFLTIAPPCYIVVAMVFSSLGVWSIVRRGKRLLVPAFWLFGAAGVISIPFALMPLTTKPWPGYEYSLGEHVVMWMGPATALLCILGLVSARSTVVVFTTASDMPVDELSLSNRANDDSTAKSIERHRVSRRVLRGLSPWLCLVLGSAMLVIVISWMKAAHWASDYLSPFVSKILTS